MDSTTNTTQIRLDRVSDAFCTAAMGGGVPLMSEGQVVSVSASAAAPRSRILPSSKRRLIEKEARVDRDCL
jgi:hypothetical protein